MNCTNIITHRYNGFLIHTRFGRLFVSSTDEGNPKTATLLMVGIEKRIYPDSFMPPGPSKTNAMEQNANNILVFIIMICSSKSAAYEWTHHKTKTLHTHMLLENLRTSYSELNSHPENLLSAIRALTVVGISVTRRQRLVGCDVDNVARDWSCTSPDSLWNIDTMKEANNVTTIICVVFIGGKGIYITP